MTDLHGFMEVKGQQRSNTVNNICTTYMIFGEEVGLRAKSIHAPFWVWYELNEGILHDWHWRMQDSMLTGCWMMKLDKNWSKTGWFYCFCLRPTGCALSLCTPLDTPVIVKVKMKPFDFHLIQWKCIPQHRHPLLSAYVARRLVWEPSCMLLLWE